MRLFELTDEQRLLGQAIQCRNPVLASESVCQLVERSSWGSALALGHRNGIACIMGHGLVEAGPGLSDATTRAGFARAHQDMATTIQRLMDDLDRVADRLASHGIPLIALKNAGIARGIFRCPGCNPMGDLDVLVRRSDFRRAHQLILNDGYVFQYRSALEPSNGNDSDRRSAAQSVSPELLDYAESTGSAEYCRRDEHGRTIWLELQWRPVAGRWIRPDQEPDANELIDRSVSIDGSNVRLLAPEDNLLQVALHTAKHSYVRAPGFRLHTDVDRIASLAMHDWDSFSRSARRFRVRTPVYFSLRLARDLLGTPVPDDVLASLRPSRFREKWIAQSLNHVGLFDPDAPKFGRIHFIAFSGLLYDNLSGLARAIFPPAKWMRQRYGCTTMQLPWAYLRRNIDLLTRHQDT